MDADTRAFLEKHHGAVMATLRKDGSPHLVRVDVGVVDGKLWSSATRDRVRTGHLRRDPRAGLFVLGENPWNWLSLDCRVTILAGDDAPELNLALYRTIAGEPDDVDEYLSAMVKEKRLIYEFEVLNTFSMQ